MSQDQNGDGEATAARCHGQGEIAAVIVRHRQHRFPARNRVVKARYDEQEYATLAAAAERAGLTPSGYLASAGLAAAGQRLMPSRSSDRELLAELLSLRTTIRRYAVNVNQAVAALHSTGDAPVWSSRAIAGAHRAVVSADAATQRVARRLS